MSENVQLKRDIAWLTTWVIEHHDSRAATHIARVLDAYIELSKAHAAGPDGVPVTETAKKYIRLSDAILSLVPAGSVFETSIADPDALVNGFVQHLYRSHTLGCVECFGGGDWVRRTRTAQGENQEIQGLPLPGAGTGNRFPH